MTGNLITSTPKADVRALAFQGIMVYTCFPQIRDMLQRKFGDDFVLIFANPVENLQNGLIDWYTPVQGEARTLESFPEELTGPICQKLESMGHEILHYAEELIKSPDPLKVTRGNILRLALSYPGKSHIFLVGNQPVITCWGFGPGTPGVEPQSITGLLAAPRTAPPKPQAEPVSPTRPAPEPVAAPRPPAAPFAWGWLWWLLPLLAACLLLLLLVTSFGHTPALSGINLIHGPELAFLQKKQDKSQEISILERDIADLNLKLHKHAAMCVPEKTHVAEAPEPEPRQELVIPPKAEDASFLEGRWLCETGLASTSTGEPIQVELSFGRDGAGKGITYEKDDQCHGAVQAKMQNGELHINLGGQVCQKSGRGYQPVSIICKNARGATTHCSGVNANGTTWDASFRKLP